MNKFSKMIVGAVAMLTLAAVVWAGVEGYTHPSTMAQTIVTTGVNATNTLVAANPNRLFLRVQCFNDAAVITTGTVSFATGTIVKDRGYANIAPTGSITWESPNTVPLTALRIITDQTANGTNLCVCTEGTK